MKLNLAYYGMTCAVWGCIVGVFYFIGVPRIEMNMFTHLAVSAIIVIPSNLLSLLPIWKK